MPVLSLTVGDLAALFLRLLPRGRVWPKIAGALQPAAIAALMPTYQRLLARDNNLLIDTFPSTTVEMLPEWEASLGLPDPCAGPDATITQRQAHVVARLTAQDGPSIPSLTAYAAALGYTIAILEYTTARYGHARYGDRYLETPWAHAWQITVTGGTLRSAQYGAAHYGDRYQTYGDAVLECEMRRLAPAHTVLRFAYGDVAFGAAWDASPGWEVAGWAA